MVLTGDISTDTLRETAGHGCVHLNKPVKGKELTRHIQRLLAKPQPAAPAGAPQLPSELERDRAATVFVVEDNRAVREAMRDLLRENGYSVQAFADGAAFFEAYRQARRDAFWSMRCEQILVADRLLDQIHSSGLHRAWTAIGTAPLPVITMAGSSWPRTLRRSISSTPLMPGISVQHALDHMRDTAKVSSWRETAAKQVASLTARQRQILDLVLAGHPSKNIAADLGHQPAHGRQPPGSHHEEDRLEVPSCADPNGDRRGSVFDQGRRGDDLLTYGQHRVLRDVHDLQLVAALQMLLANLPDVQDGPRGLQRGAGDVELQDVVSISARHRGGTHHLASGCAEGTCWHEGSDPRRLDVESDEHALLVGQIAEYSS
jgi:FixJ family two-component response regulator